MTCFPRSVWCDEWVAPYPERRHDPHDAANTNAVVVDRRVTHAGFVEVTSHV